MEGVILSAETAQGLILGDDGIQYTFNPLEWSNDDIWPEAGVRVVFEVRDYQALGVYPTSVPTPAAPPKKSLGMNMKWWQWAVAAGGSLIVLGIVGAVLLGIFPGSGPFQDTSVRGSVYHELLNMVPDTDQCKEEVTIHDYDAIRETFDIHLRGGPDHMDWMEGEVGTDHPATVGISPWLGPFHNHSVHMNKMNLQYFAFGYQDMRQGLTSHCLPDPSVTEVLRGDFDPQLTHDALMACSECPSPDIEEHRGTRFYSWGGDNQANVRIRLSPPAFDQIGRGGRIAVSDSYVLRTLSTPNMKSAIDAGLDKGSSLADAAEYRDMANTISGLGVYNALLSTDTERFDFTDSHPIFDQLDERDVREVEKGPWLRPYEGFAFGNGKDQYGSFAAIALFHSNGSLAEENVELLGQIIEEGFSLTFGQPWSDYIELDRSTIHAEGRTLIAKLRGPRITRVINEVRFTHDHLIGYRRL